MLRNLRRLLTGVFVFSAVSLFAAQVAAAQPGFAEVPGSPFATGTSPQSIAFSPNGALAATANAGGNDVSVFTVSSSRPPRSCRSPGRCRPRRPYSGRQGNATGACNTPVEPRIARSGLGRT
jgi:DNA-binding beta-propeller fold protein YncE